MFKLLEKIAINFLIKRGIILKEKNTIIKSKSVGITTAEPREIKENYYIREPAKIITSKAIQKKRFIKNFGIEINNYKNENNNKTNF